MLATLGVLSALLAGPQVAAPDTFADATARELVLRAADRRNDAAEGLASYEAILTERVWIGVRFGPRLLTRSRTLYHREQVARGRWSRDEDALVRWIGRREGTPAFRDLPFGIDFNPAQALDLDDFVRQTLFDPGGDRIDLFQAGWIQPVSPAGLSLYRFRSGDTLHIGLPPPNRSLDLVEVVVQPRVQSWETVEGSLWFDAETGDLTRAIFRPSGVWDHDVQEPGDLKGAPAFVKPGIGTVEVVAIDYALFEGRWWLPRRLAARGVYDWGHGFAQMPLEIEWSLRDFALNEVPTEELASALDPGAYHSITSIRRNSRSTRTVYVTPPGDLSRSPELPPPLFQEPLEFTAEELGPLLDSFEQTTGEQPLSPPPSLRRTLLSGLRYNRIQGVSVGGSRSWRLPRGDARVDLEARLGLADLEPGARVALARGRWKTSTYRELADAMEIGQPFGIGASMDALLLGQDDGDYYWRTGGEVGATWGDRSRSLSLKAFGERQTAAALEARWSVTGDLRPNIDAEEADAFGLRWDGRVQKGDDPRSGVATGRLWGEAAAGDTDYWRALGSVSVTRHLLGGLAGATSLGVGVTSEGTPIQRSLFTGGTHTLRGFQGGRFRGTGAWWVRAEIGTRGEALRASLFSDAAWAGPRDRFWDCGPGVSLGLGASVMDGLLRLDLARGVVRGEDWRLHFYLDGVF